MAVRFNRNFDVNRIVKRLVRSVLALYVGGTIMTTFGDVMANTSSPFYNGLSLIGWTVGSSQINATVSYASDCGGTTAASNWTAVPSTGPNTNCITDTTGSGVLAVVGIIAIAQIVTEFIQW